MDVPDDPQTVRRLLDLCQEAVQLTGDAETVKRIDEYADELRRRLDHQKRDNRLDNDHK